MRWYEPSVPVSRRSSSGSQSIRPSRSHGSGRAAGPLQVGGDVRALGIRCRRGSRCAPLDAVRAARDPADRHSVTSAPARRRPLPRSRSCGVAPCPGGPYSSATCCRPARAEAIRRCSAVLCSGQRSWPRLPGRPCRRPRRRRSRQITDVSPWPGTACRRSCRSASTPRAVPSGDSAAVACRRSTASRAGRGTGSRPSRAEIRRTGCRSPDRPARTPRAPRADRAGPGPRSRPTIARGVDVLGHRRSRCGCRPASRRSAAGPTRPPTPIATAAAATTAAAEHPVSAYPATALPPEGCEGHQPFDTPLPVDELAQRRTEVTHRAPPLRPENDPALPMTRTSRAGRWGGAEEVLGVSRAAGSAGRTA